MPAPIFPASTSGMSVPSPNSNPSHSHNALGYTLTSQIRPLDLHVDPKLKAKIWGREFVNLFSLLPTSPVEVIDQNITLDEEGKLAILKEKKGKISTIASWNEAWRIYITVAIQNPAFSVDKGGSTAIELIQYMNHINALHAQGADWAYYDECFRRDAQFSPTLFSTVDHTLVLDSSRRGSQAVTGRAATRNPGRTTSYQAPLAGSTTPNPRIAEAKQKLARYQIPVGYCLTYLAGLSCTYKECRYYHACPWCQTPHTASQCPQPSFKSNQRTDNVPGGHVPRSGWSAPPAPRTNPRQNSSNQTSRRQFYPRDSRPQNRRFWHSLVTPVLDVPCLLYSVQPVVKVPFFQDFLRDGGYDRSAISYLVDGLNHGFDLGYIGDYVDMSLPNLISARRRPQILSELIDTEISEGRFLGPFSSPPFNFQRINPLGLVPKKAPNSFRLIVDLSQPLGNSVNSHIPRDASSVSYPSIQQAIDIILSLTEQGFSPVLFKMDIKSAFRLLPLSPSNFSLLGVQLDNKFYVDAFLPMGSSSSCQIFQKFSDAIAFLMHTHAGVDYVINYLDDFLGIEKDPVLADHKMKSTQTMGDQLGIPFAPEKSEGPAPVLTFLGIELDCTSLEARLPPDKIHKAIRLIQSFLTSPRQHLKRIESLHGFLNFCAEIIPAGRAFLRSLQPLLHHTGSHWITVPPQVISDLKTWLDFLHNFNGKAMFVPSGWDLPSVLHLETDSSGSWGCAAIFQNQFFALQWPPTTRRTNLALLEFYPIVVSTFVWGPSLANKRLLIHCDNLATVFIVNKLKSQEPNTMALVRMFALQCLNFNIWFQARHIPGSANHGPDALSRGKFEEFHRSFPGMSPALLSIPDPLQPWNCLPR